MAYRYEKEETGAKAIVIDGWENGIADSPELGIADIRNMDIYSVPQEASVMFANSAISIPPTVSAVAFTVVATTDTFTWAGGSTFYSGMAITINSLSGGTGITNGRTYYVGNITATTFKIYTDVRLLSLVDVTLDGSGTFSTVLFTSAVDMVSASSTTFLSSTGQSFRHTFIMASDGLIWYISSIAFGNTAAYTLIFTGNRGHSTAQTLNTGIMYVHGYIFGFFSTKIDYLSFNDFISGANLNTTWTYGWQTITTSLAGHRAIYATDDVIYFCNATTVGSILFVGGTTFDPADTGTYTYNDTALQLPDDYATCLAQLGVNLLVGGIQQYVYPWDRTSTSFSYPLIMPEFFTKCIVSTNANAYILCGNKGRIYLTNGSNVQLFKKFPDSLSATVDPYYSFGWGIYWKNKLLFSLTATTNANVSVDSFAGIWGIDLDTSGLALYNELSYDAYTGSVPIFCQTGAPIQPGIGLFIGWIDVNSVGGLDKTVSTPYTNFESRIDTDLIPVGTFYDKRTNAQVEFKLSRPLVSGESIRISWRETLADSFTAIWTNSTVGTFSDAKQVNFQKLQWVQFRIETSSTASTPSYVRLREIRLR